MATQSTPQFKAAARKSPVNRRNREFVQFTTTSAVGAGEHIKVLRLPKGARVIPQECLFYATNDPDSANDCTVTLQYSDGTTTKNISAAGATFQAADTVVAGTTTQLVALDEHFTENALYEVRLVRVAGDIDLGANIVFYISYDAT